MSTTETQAVDGDLSEELWRIHVGGDGKTVEGEVTRIRKSGNTGRIAVDIETPTEDTFNAYFDMPTTGDSSERFVRFLAEYGYNLSNFEHLVGTTVDCTHDESWKVIVPDEPVPLRKRLLGTPSGTGRVALKYSLWSIFFPLLFVAAALDALCYNNSSLDVADGTWPTLRAGFLMPPWLVLVYLLF